jgi:thioredoxin-like negative regulator of GroEL
MDVYLKKIFSAFRLLVIFQMLVTSFNVKAVETCEAVFVASSGVATINSADAELINFITGGLLGLNIKLSVADTEYSALLAAGIELESYLDTLAVDLSVANKSDAVAANISLVQAIDAAITVLQAQGSNALAIATLNSIKVQAPVGTFSFSDVIDLNAEDSAVLSTTVNLLDFHMLIVQAFNHQNAISAQNISLNLSSLGLDGTVGPLSVSLGDISAALIAVEGPKLVSGPVGTAFTTSSIRLRILADLVDVAAAPLTLGVASVAVTLTDFEIYADVARANGTVDQLSYLSQTLRLNVTPGVASLYLGQISAADFNDRTLNSNIDYATEVSPVTIGSIDISVFGSSETIALRARANANANGSLESLNFIAPFPESQTTTAGASITNTLLSSLISNTELSLAVGPVLVDPTLLLSLVKSLVLDDILSPVISSILTNFADPVMSALGISIGNATEKVFAINGDSCIPTIDSLNTADSSPLLSGLAYRSTEDSELLTIELNNITYQEDIDFVVTNNQWSLTVPPGDSLSEGTYNVIATVTNGIDSIVDQSNAELTIDLTRPSIQIQNVPSNSSAAFTATFLFSEPVNNFTLGDILVSNGSASDFTSITSSTYTALISPIADGTVTLDVNANVVQDIAGNLNTAATQVSSTFEATRPSVVIQGVPVTSNSAFTATFVFSSNVTGFILNDISVDNGIASNFLTINGSTYTADIAPSANGVVTVDVFANVAQDGSGNLNTAATQVINQYDTVPPSVAIQSVPANSNMAFTATFVFSEAVTGFSHGDITLINATASNFTTVNSSTYSALITPLTDGLVALDVGVGVAQDSAGNLNTAATQVNSQYDTSRPSVVIQNVLAVSSAPFTATFSFSEAVTDFTVSDIAISNGAASNFSVVNSSTYSALISPSIGGTVTIDVNANVAQDIAGNQNTAAAQVSSNYIATLPTVTIQNVPENSNTAFTATFAFSEAVTGFEVGDISLINATASAFATVNSSTYTALITPSAQGLVTLNVGVNVAQDSVGNFNIAAVPVVSLFDTTRPSIAIQGVQPQNITPFTATFTFSEAVADFIVSDITLTNATASAFTTVSSSSYTALITPIADGTITLNVNANVAQDVAGNLNTAATQVSTEFDAILPTVTIQNVPANSNTAFTATFAFSEAVTGFEVGDISLINATASAFATVNSSTYTALITPSAQGLVTLNVGINVAQDSVGNFNIAAVPVVSLFDTTRPSVAIQGVQPQNITPFTATFTFSEAVADFIVSDITLTNATASAFTTVSSSSYTALITPIADGTITLNVNANVAQDVAGNLNTAATQVSTEFDAILPTVTIQNVPANSNTAFTATFAFSEAVTGFEVGDISLINATASAFATVNSSTYTALITPSAQGLVTLNVGINVAQDSVGNFNIAAVPVVSLFDTTRPSVAIQGVQPQNITPFTATFTFSEAVADFIVSDITLTNATASAFTTVSSSSYTALITPIADGTITLNVNANVAQDVAGNLNTAATQVSTEFNGSRPTVSIENVPARANSSFTATFLFSEIVIGFELSDINVTNANIGNFTVVDGSTYTAVVTPTIDGLVTLNVNANVAQDIQGNLNTAATQVSGLYDTSRPTIVIQNVPANSLDAFTATFEFNETVIGFTLSDISLTNATATNFTVIDGNTYTALITPSLNGLVTLAVNANVAQDSAGNLNTAATQVTSEYDASRPSVVIQNIPTATNIAFSASFVFSEPVSDFAANDITVTNASITNFTVIDSSNYSALITASIEGNITIDVNENVAIDNFGNFNTAATQATSIYDITAPDVSILSGPVINSVNQLNYQIEGTCSTSDSVVSVTINALDPRTAVCDDGTWQLNQDFSTIADGEGAVSINASQSDNADNIGNAEPVVINKDTEDPTLSLDRVIYSENDALIFIGSSNTEDGSAVSIIESTDNNLCNAIVNTRAWSCESEVILSEGTYDLRAEAEDEAGNLSIIYFSQVVDLDEDNDGIDNSVEGYGDSDNDGIPNAQDSDSDNDGIPDSEEGVEDDDRDTIPNYLDTSLDEDIDGIPDVIEGSADIDNDGIINAFDIDSDNDGILDSFEAQISGNDNDEDGIDDIFDADIGGDDPDGDGISYQAIDTDNDGIADLLDADSDGDRIPDALEAFIGFKDIDNDGIWDRYDQSQTGGVDVDNDGIDDLYDADQTNGLDADNDGINDLLVLLNDHNQNFIPDHLEIDSDNDGIHDSVEAQVSGFDHDNDGIDDTFDADLANEVDTNGDGIIDIFTFIDTDADGVIDMNDLDSDNDGDTDVFEANIQDDDNNAIADAGTPVLTVVIDTDTDNIPDYVDLDKNNDDNFDIQENAYSSFDLNNDGRVDITADIDGDGIDDSVDGDNQVLGHGDNADSDNDSVLDVIDQDDDNDGIADVTERAFENTANVVNRFYGTNSVSSRGKLNNETRRVIDSDNDGIIDEKDRDSDNDGISDLIENGRPNLTGLDHDRDGIDNAFDADFTGGTDEDQDGVDDTYIVKDTDQDSVPDYLDQDSDNDNISDNVEQLTVPPSGIDANGNGIDDAFDPAFNNNQDDNLDGIDDTLVVLSNPDGDDILNFQDTDSDGDNIRDIDEQAVDFDSDGTPNYLDLDSDNDNITDAIEGLSDFDTDGASNFLDLDSDNDNISDAIEGEADFDTDGASNFLDLDSDNDNISDAIEGEDDFDADGASNFLDLDSDNDDISDEAEGESDFDSDGASNFLDLDSDNDGISDKVEGVTDFDVDGSSNYLDLDSDGDGISDAEEGDIDTDNDGTPNFLDLDSDNDGISDKDENGDFDADGVNDANQGQGQVESSLKGSGSFQGPAILLLIILCLIRNRKRSVTMKILL